MSATIIRLADHCSEPAKAFEPAQWPEVDYNIIGHWLREAALQVREGRFSSREIPDLLDRLSANAFMAQREMKDITFRMVRAEKKLRPKYKNLKGAELARAIRYGLPEGDAPKKAKKRPKRK